MNNAIWLMLALPLWYFFAILAPTSAGFLTAIPALGAVCLIVGTAWGIARRDRRLLLFVIPAMLSEIMVAVAGVNRGRLTSASASPILLAFLAIEVLICLALIALLRGNRGPAVALAIFGCSFALFAAFVASMAFTDQWL